MPQKPSTAGKRKPEDLSNEAVKRLRSASGPKPGPASQANPQENPQETEQSDDESGDETSGAKDPVTPTPRPAFTKPPTTIIPPTAGARNQVSNQAAVSQTAGSAPKKKSPTTKITPNVETPVVKQAAVRAGDTTLVKKTPSNTPGTANSQSSGQAGEGQVENNAPPAKKAKRTKKKKTPTDPPKDAEMAAPNESTEANKETAPDDDDNSGFEIVVRKNKGLMAKPTDVFKILDPKDYPEIKSFNHVAPFGQYAHPEATPEFWKWVKNNKRKVLVTIIGAFKNRNALYAFEKTLKLIHQAAAFVVKGKTEAQSMGGCDWLILETKNEEAAQALIKARLVLNIELNVVVLFREIKLKYSEIRSLQISFLGSKEIYKAFEKALEEIYQVKIIDKVTFKTEDDAKEKTTDKAIWIVRPDDPKGHMDEKVYPIPGSNRIVIYTETYPCPICGGEDHRGNECAWKDRVDTWWGASPHPGPNRKKEKTTTTEVTVTEPTTSTAQNVENEQANLAAEESEGEANLVDEGSDMETSSDEEDSANTAAAAAANTTD